MCIFFSYFHSVCGYWFTSTDGHGLITLLANTFDKTTKGPGMYYVFPAVL